MGKLYSSLAPGWSYGDPFASPWIAHVDLTVRELPVFGAFGRISEYFPRSGFHLLHLVQRRSVANAAWLPSEHGISLPQARDRTCFLPRLPMSNTQAPHARLEKHVRVGVSDRSLNARPSCGHTWLRRSQS